MNKFKNPWSKGGGHFTDQIEDTVDRWFKRGGADKNPEGDDDNFELDIKCLNWLYTEIDAMITSMQADMSESTNTGESLYDEIRSKEFNWIDRLISNCGPCCADVISVTVKYPPPSSKFETQYSQTIPFQLGTLRVQNRGERSFKFGKMQESFIIDLQIKIRDPKDCPPCM